MRKGQILDTLSRIYGFADRVDVTMRERSVKENSLRFFVAVSGRMKMLFTVLFIYLLR